jgi:hypothetical protein
MPAKQIADVVVDASERMGTYYRDEYVRLLQEYRGIGHVDASGLSSERFTQIVREARGDDALRASLAQLLKSNLRAIPLFGPEFAEGILQRVSDAGMVAIGEESRGVGTRAIVVAGVALALVLAGAAGEHVIANVRAQSAATPLPVVAMPAVAPPSTAAPIHRRRAVVAQAIKPNRVPPQTAAPAVTPQVAAPQVRHSQAQQAQAQVQPQPTPPPAIATAPHRPKAAAARAKRWMPKPAEGVATIAVPDPTPTPEPSALDVSDMPDAFSDATPLPPPSSAAPAQVPNRVSLTTPQPADHKPRGLINKTLHFTLHLVKSTLNTIDPFKPHP